MGNVLEDKLTRSDHLRPVEGHLRTLPRDSRRGRLGHGTTIMRRFLGDIFKRPSNCATLLVLYKSTLAFEERTGNESSNLEMDVVGGPGSCLSEHPSFEHHVEDFAFVKAIRRKRQSRWGEFYDLHRVAPCVLTLRRKQTFRVYSNI